MTSGTRPEPRRSDADEVDAGGLSWEVFVGNLAEVAGSPVESLGYETPLADLVGSGASAVLVKTFIVKTARGLSRQALESCETLGEAYEWCARRREGTEITRDVRSPPEDADRESPVWLRPVRSGDIGAMYEASQSPRSAFRWRFRGPFPSPGQFSELAFRGVLVQLVVEDKATRSAHGVVIAYDHMPEHGVCFLAFQRFGASRDGGEMFLGMFHFVEYLFQRWTLRKLYVDLPEYNADLIGDGLGVITEEGRLREFSYYDGRYWDRIFYAIDRDLWEHKAQVWHLYLTDGLAPDVR